ncbi:nitroreductase family deazaflavin-dependent oxidoreductase [Actinomadura litoris]|uniref:nitroreductase family deazaflavin-dependent oxidoreductase n=1 Tax=Actinomadura litoris TaxID=2678616 RepID=UPI001FA73C51|nr:nitroreductase family deazaflavin-dependent oxidoreductase [Actinomadura litoris]
MSIQRRLARFNKIVANRIIGRPMARMPGFGALFHTGRRSGRLYRIPVKVFRRDGVYVLPMPYGPDCDWVRNVVAAGGCELRTRGRRVKLADPHVIIDERQHDIPAHIRFVLLRLGIKHFMVLNPV